MPEEILSGLGVKVTPANWDTLKLLRSSTPPKPYVVYRIDTDSFIAVTLIFSSEKLIPSFDNLDEFKLLISLDTSKIDAYKNIWGDYICQTTDG